jgi:Ca-activated chloride channel family protein
MQRRLLTAALAALAVMVVPSSSGQSLKDQSTRPPQQEQGIRVEVNLVSVIASVLTRDGRAVTGLPKESFELYEEGVKQRIDVFEAETQQPLDLALMLDTSASTFKELPLVRQAAARFIRQVVRPVDRLAVYQFTESVEELARFSSNVPALEASLGLLETGGGTAMYDALVLGSRALERRPLGRRRVIILVTDAGESASLSKFEDARRAPLAAEAMLYTILIRPVKNESGRNTGGEHALITVTEGTGGAMYTVDDESQLAETYERINRELRTQYRLGYYPNPREPASAAGSFRKLDVRVHPSAGGEGYVVRHRQGYFLAAP